jgi:YtkA-like protein
MPVPLPRRLRTPIVGLFLTAACLGPAEGGDGCACRAEPEPASALPASTEPSSATPAPVPLLLESSATPPALPDFSDPSWTRVPSRAGAYLVCWRPEGGKVPRNEDFTLEVWVLRDGAPVRDGQLSVSAWMPDHGHGMLRTPRSTVQSDGSFRIEGMLLHMRGHWQVFFEVLEGNLAETAECALDL